LEINILPFAEMGGIIRTQARPEIWENSMAIMQDAQWSSGPGSEIQVCNILVIQSVNFLQGSQLGQIFPGGHFGLVERWSADEIIPTRDIRGMETVKGSGDESGST
jgi:hypothetical protein